MKYRGRGFRLLLAGVLSAIAIVSWLNISLGSSSSLSESTIINSVLVTTETPSHPELSYAAWTSADAADASRISQARSVLDAELSKYPQGHLSDNGVERIYLVKNLNWGGQTQSAMPEAFIDQALYLSIDDNYLQAEAGAYYRQLIHHEIRHLLDAHAYGSYRYIDASWLACNPLGFTYSGSGLEYNKSGQNTRIEHPDAGFITSYSRSAIEEDRAEVHAYLMTKPSVLDKLTSEDTSLSCKKQLVVQFNQSL